MFANTWLVTLPMGMPCERSTDLSLSLSLSSLKNLYRSNSVASDDFREKPQRHRVANTALKELQQDIMVNTVEELPDIRLPEPAMLIAMEEPFSSIQGFMQALVLATRPGVVQERSVVDTDEFVVENAVHEAVTDGGHGDPPSLVIADRERPVRAMTVGAAAEIFVKLLKVLLKAVPELLEFSSVLLAPHEGKPVPIENF